MTTPHRTTQPDHIAAHEHCTHNRAELEWSDSCGCFSCTSIFPSSLITEWIDRGQTALCPECKGDTVLGSAAGFPITIGLLERMHAHWF